MARVVGFVAALLLAACATPAPQSVGQAPAVEPAVDGGDYDYDVLIKGGTIYDGSGGAPYVADIAVEGDRITAIYPRLKGDARVEIDARGKAVAPGFINMLSWATDNLLVDGRGLSDLKQGVTLEVMGEGDWITLDEYLGRLERQGAGPNVAAMVGAAAVREHVLGEGDVDPTPEQLARMKALVASAMEDGALGVSSPLIQVPAEMDELVAVAAEARRCGGIHTSHMLYERGREARALSLAEAVRKLTSLPAANLGLKERGRVMPGWHADIVVFDPKTVADRATYEDPRPFAVGVEHVIVNGGVALRNGEPTGTLGGKIVRGRAWKGWKDGGCRASAADWKW